LENDEKLFAMVLATEEVVVVLMLLVGLDLVLDENNALLVLLVLAVFELFMLKDLVKEFNFELDHILPFNRGFVVKKKGLKC
jgi:hypothetical protein